MYKILIIDDNKFIRKLTSEVLCKEYEVFTLSDWSLANQYLFKNQVDLVLMDVQMPGVKGDTITRVFKDTITIRSPKIVLFSALEETVLQQKSSECGADGYICKSSDFTSLIKEVKRFV